MGQGVQQTQLEQQTALASLSYAQDSVQSLTQTIGGSIQSQFETLGAGINLQSLIQVPEIDVMNIDTMATGNHPVVQMDSSSPKYNRAVNKKTKEIQNDIRNKKQVALDKLNKSKQEQLDEISRSEQYIEREFENSKSYWQKSWDYKNKSPPGAEKNMIRSQEMLKQEELRFQNTRREWMENHYDRRVNKIENKFDKEIDNARDRAIKEVSNQVVA